MDRLKNFIDTNREAFDDEPLPEGHFERFEQKLATPHRGRTICLRFAVLTAAACLALFFLRLPDGMPAGTELDLTAEPCTCEMQEEIEELQLYYRMQMNDIVAQMHRLSGQGEMPGAAGLLAESRRVLTDSSLFEDTVFPSLPCTHDGLYVINRHYSSSLACLNRMLEQMKRIEK